MTAREWLDAVEARQAIAVEPLMPHWDYHQQVAWDRARSEVVRTDVPALVAALRAVQALCVRARMAPGAQVPSVYVSDILATIDAHLGGAS